MKIFVNQIPPEGMTLTDSLSARSLDLDTEIIKLIAPVRVEAQVSRGINFVSVVLSLAGSLQAVCSLCLVEFPKDFEKRTTLNIPLDKGENVIELTEDIREAILLDYPIKPLCKPDCRGICPLCGANLNEEKCGCKIV